MHKSPIVVLDQVSKSIDNKIIVQPLSLQVSAGNIVALCGGNGAGKSTLLRMIAGIIQPTTGKLTVNGLEHRKKRKEYAECIGYMPDDFHFHQPLSALELLAFYAQLKGVNNERVLQLLEQVGLTEVRHKPASAYSKGMRQRLLFAQALLAKPPLLILDEPTNGLDPYWMDAFIDLLLELKKAGHTVVFSTHQLHIAEKVADQVVFMADGHVLRSAGLRELMQEYPSRGLNGAFSELLSQSIPAKE
ncbi:heme ABC exporter ATP-binding protein CcmA [Paenibacillus senegalensis]|uniref:heme ABC exporter ATP-binding protein CcmA n=1 Tax=Paenibacillus senegalensis TaxID=1465766 RepID=UPI000288CE97|nr:heme ABC exporter ATP-binding protein CcmA [Paenibacillus senegalensis]